jgi:MinD-like ATPase involved in chromosome partitioning or flagellar assembly
VDLPTYTNIWRIEKRLYKLYDFRLPMPLPVGQIAVFTAIAIPYVIILTLLGLPFSHTSFWLYVLPPGVLAWLATRPVLESKRLPELIVSQVRYLGEPRTWCRLAALAEKDEVLVVARVWCRAAEAPAELAARRAAEPTGRRILAAPKRVVAATARLAAAEPQSPPAPSAPAWPASPALRSAAGAARPAAGARSAAVPAWPAAAAVRPATGAHARPAAIEQERAPAAAEGWVPARIPAAGHAQAAGHAPAAGRVPAAGHAHAAGHAAAAGQPPHAQAAGRAPAAAPPTAAYLPVIPAAAVGQPLPRPPAASPPAAARPPAAGTRPAADAPAARPPAPDGPPAMAPGAGVPAARRPAADVPPARPPAADAAAARPPATDVPPAQPAGLPVARPLAGRPPAASPPHVTVTGDRQDGRPLRVVERALRGPADNHGDGWHDRVVVVPGGHRPGRPDFQQRDRARTQLPVAGCRRIVVLGCTVGAGQTMTALMTGEVLASVRDEPVAVLDLNPGPGSLAERADSMPALARGPAGGGQDHLHHPPAPSRLAVISSEPAAAAGPPDDAAEDVARIFELLSARYTLTLADPGASAVPRVLAIADQLVLVAPASQDAARAIAMTLEWLEAHGHAELAGNSATVINGVSPPTISHVEQAEAVARGRCRAIVRVPWDDQLKKPEVKRIVGGDPVAPLARPGGRLLGPAAVQAYTALAGVLVAGLATAPELRRAQL